MKVRDLVPLHDPATSGRRPELERLSDDELLNAVRNPRNGRFMTINTRTGRLVDGNGRTYELLRRAADPASSITPDTDVPVERYEPDTSMFYDLGG